MKGYYIKYVPALDDFKWYINTGDNILVLSDMGYDLLWLPSFHHELNDAFEFVCDLEGNDTPEGYYIKDFEYVGCGLYRYMNGELLALGTSHPGVTEIDYIKSMYASPEKEYGFEFAFDLELRR